MLNKIKKHVKYWQGQYVENEEYRHAYYGEIRYLGALQNGYCLVDPIKVTKSAIVTRHNLLHL